MILYDSYYGKGPYFNNCPKFFDSCQSLIMENLEELFSETDYFDFAVSNSTKLRLKRSKTWKFEQWPWPPIHLTFYEVNSFRKVHEVLQRYARIYFMIKGQ